MVAAALNEVIIPSDIIASDVGVAAQVLKALVGDVVIERQQIEGQEKPQMVARFSINAVPALAVLERGQVADLVQIFEGKILAVGSDADQPAGAGGQACRVIPADQAA